MADVVTPGAPEWVERAVAALSAFRGLSRAQAAVLLSLWTHRDRLTDAEVVQVLDRVAPRRTEVAR